ncbi:nucleotide sugar dehydrogenase [Halococcus thailandensis]|uniref:UDP-N-acetyl-D-mannosamine dehydrogenase n=1 Tax=Halococcus thailandensis JCM 13552 TaxID=1227457 RepID=M0N8N6_9EURY|nr:nucleotide sugar dehydrogenase [Halococcus thailandensis]EMA54327.1 UDP-glucose/GDP-mannose dehydrogenase [Halococcus thailandensis JCM 13552]
MDTKIDTENDRIGIVGLGYVGLPLSLAFADAGYDVIGVDIDRERIEQLHDGCSYVSDVSDDRLQQHLDSTFEPTTEYEALSDVVGVCICVPTPLRKTGNPDISYVAEATEELAGVLPDGCTVVLESTVYPGATEDVVAQTFTKNGSTVGEDVFIAFSPERIDPGNEEYAPADIPKVLGGVTAACSDRAEALYAPVFEKIVPVDSSTEAELVKLIENTFRSVNIALSNEIARAAHEFDANIWRTIDAAATKPFGFMPFYPGPGLGGHCIPIDPQYLSWKANKRGVDMRLIGLADRINRNMPTYVMRRMEILLDEEGIPMPEADVLVVGVAYKANVSDTRESPALDVIGCLEDRGASVCYHDPYVRQLDTEERTYESVRLTSELLAEQDCVVILTDHSTIDFEAIVDYAPLIFDTRNALDGLTNENTDTVYRL